MIETISLGAREIDLSINAESQTLPEERRPWLYLSNRLGAVKKKYYLESEGFIFFDEGRAISIAAQIVKWIHTDIGSGRHYILLPFDNTTYVATIRVQTDYILVEKEELLPFEECMELLRRSPLECQVAELGKLSNAFTQHNIALRDLYINLEPGKNNPYLLRRGYNLFELSFSTFVLCVGVGLMFLIISTLNLREIKPTATKPAPVIPKSTIQIDTDLEAIATLLDDFSVLLAYRLENISVSKTAQGYLTRANGRYEQVFPLTRLHVIAGALEGRFSAQKNSWTLDSSLFDPPSGASVELAPLSASFEGYRQFAVSSNVSFSVVGSSQKQGVAQAMLSLSMDYPNRDSLRQAALQLRQMSLHGYLQSIEIKADEYSGWKQLTAVIEITGT